MLFDGKSMCKINAPKVVSSENKNQHILQNPEGKEVYKYRIDGDIIKEENVQRCDYIVEVNELNCQMVFVIELKGSDLTKAIKQIENTITIFKEKLKRYTVYPRVVIHKVSAHDIHSSVYREFKKRFPNFKNGTMVVEDIV